MCTSEEAYRRCLVLYVVDVCSKLIVSECNVVASAGGGRHPAGMQGGQQSAHTVVSTSTNCSCNGGCPSLLLSKVQ